MTKIFFSGFILGMRTDKVSFGAKPLYDTKIKKFDREKTGFVELPVNFVKLEPSDIRIIDVLAETWEGAEYINKIATASHWMKTVPIDIYAITEQKNNFDRLDPLKILGIAEIRNDDMRQGFKQLHYLQVNPEAINVDNNGRKFYKLTGTTILNSLKKLYKNISLFSNENTNVKKFYENNGFIEDFMGKNHYIWSTNIITKLKVMYYKYMHRNRF